MQSSAEDWGHSFLTPFSKSLLCLELLSGRQRGGFKPPHKPFKCSTLPCEACAEVRPRLLSPEGVVAFLEFLGWAPPPCRHQCFAWVRHPLFLASFSTQCGLH